MSGRTTARRGSRSEGQKDSPLSGASPLPIHPLLLNHHRPSFEPLLTTLESTGKIGPVLLFTGPVGVGKRSIVTHLAQTLLCTGQGSGEGKHEQEEDGPSLFGIITDETAKQPSEKLPSVPREPCSRCANCLRALQNQWIDFTEIQSERDDAGEKRGTLKIDQFRDLKRTQGHGAYSGRYRIILIRDADQMTSQAANSLLKILEEPPPGWLIFLTTADATLLLPTLVSRCQMVRLKPLPDSTLQDLLKTLPSGQNLTPDRLQQIITLAQGSLGRALQYCDEVFWNHRHSLLRFIQSPNTEWSSLVDWASQSVHNLEQLVHQLELLAFERLLNHPQSRNEIQLRLERLFRARIEITTPVNKKLLVQDLLSPWCLEPIGGPDART